MPANAALIAVLIMERPLCLECISTKAGLLAAAVSDYLTAIATHLELYRRESDRCRACGETRPVVALLRASS